MEGYLWLAGGKVCENSREAERDFTAKVGRCEVRASQRINKKNKTLIIEMIDPTLETKFHLVYMSG